MVNETCRRWGRHWASQMPDPVVAEQIVDPEGLLNMACVEPERLRSLVEQELLDLDELDLEELPQGERETILEEFSQDERVLSTEGMVEQYEEVSAEDE